MGKASRRKKERVKGDGVEAAVETASERGSSLIRNIMLWGVPLIAGGLVYMGIYSMENDLFAGIAGLGGAGLWIILLLSDLGKTIPPSGRSSGASIDFGTR